jgi:hypothetical protein
MQQGLCLCLLQVSVAPVQSSKTLFNNPVEVYSILYRVVSSQMQTDILHIAECGIAPHELTMLQVDNYALNNRGLAKPQLHTQRYLLRFDQVSLLYFFLE